MKPHAVLKLAKYFVVQDSNVVKLNQNESPYDIPLVLKRKILKRLAAAQWNRYPKQKPAALLEAISKYVGVRPDNVVIGNSSNEMIQAIIQAVCIRGDKLVTVSPGFAIYPRVGRIMGLKVQEVELGQNFEFNTEKIINAAQDTQLVMIASPNSPTGTVFEISEIELLLKKTKCLVAIDEAYYEFYRKTALKFLGKYKNLIIIRTLSKAFSLAGARLGYMIARPDIAEAVESVKLPFSVGYFAQAAGLEVLGNDSYVRASVSRVTGERKRVFSELMKFGCIKPIPSKTNFILFEIKGKKARNVFDTLYKKGVLVRPYDSARLKNYLRVTMGKRRENDIFLKTLKSEMEES